MKQVNLRRSTDCGNVPPRRSAFDNVRRVLGLVPVTESLRSLSYWRRLKAGARQNGTGS